MIERGELDLSTEPINGGWALSSFSRQGTQGQVFKQAPDTQLSKKVILVWLWKDNFFDAFL